MKDDAELDELAFRLFKLFARMEYALKAVGCLRQQTGRAEPSWQQFAQRIDANFTAAVLEDCSLRTSVEWLLDHPPRQQVVRDGELGWADAEVDRFLGSIAVLDCVKRVRNNLFHGGKFNGHWIDPERSTPLIEHSLVVLEGCLRVDSEVSEAFK